MSILQELRRRKVFRLMALFLTIVFIFSFTPVALAGQAEDLATFKQAYLQYEKFFKHGDLRKALPEARLAYELGQQLLGAESKETAKLTYNYGNILLRLRRFNEAEPVLSDALERFEHVFGKESVELVPVLMDSGHLDANINKGKTRKKLYKRAFMLCKQQYGGQSEEFAWFSVKAGVDMIYIAHDRRGEKYLKAGYDVLQSRLGEDHARTGFAAYHLGKYELSIKNYEAARQYLIVALASFERPDEPSGKIELSTHAFLVRVYAELGESKLATQHSLAIGRMTPFDSSQNYFPIYKQPPVYPKSALRARIEGYVVLQYDVDENGFVRDPRLVKLEGDKNFEQVSFDAVQTFRYAPRFIDGQAVVVKGVQNKFNFSIKK